MWLIFVAALGAAATVSVLWVGYRTRSAVVLGFGLGVVAFGLLLSVGLLCWVAVSGVDGGSLYPAVGGLFGVSLIAAGNASNVPPDGEQTVSTVLLVGVSVTLVVEFALAVLSELPRG